MFHMQTHELNSVLKLLIVHIQQPMTLIIYYIVYNLFNNFKYSLNTLFIGNPRPTRGTI
jgi:hypothetical protein